MIHSFSTSRSYLSLVLYVYVPPAACLPARLVGFLLVRSLYCNLCVLINQVIQYSTVVY